MIGSKSTSQDFFAPYTLELRIIKRFLIMFFSSCDILDEVSHTFQIHISKKSKS